jgi:glycosyltransferase involved in cell wall biosynthesis
MVRPCPVAPAEAVVAITRSLAQLKPHFLISLGDIPWLHYIASAELQKALSSNRTRWCLYYPVDGTLPDGRLPRQWASVLSKADLPVAMSEFGMAATTRSGIAGTLIPHGCDTETFRPPKSKEAAKRRLGYDGKFVILSDVRNHRRKLIPRALDIIRRLDVAPGKLVFHLHTSANTQEDKESYRYDLHADIELLKLDAVTGMRDSDGELSMSALANLYAAADVHLLTSFGEGFGLPTLQAASAGVVPVVAANSASTELVRDHGFAIPCDSWATDEFGLLRGYIDRELAASALRDLYNKPGLLQARSAAARRFALAYTWDETAERWDRLLTRAGARRSRGSRGTRRTEVAEASSFSTPGLLPLRPTGHDSSVLPIPRIGVPTRLELRREGAMVSTSPLVVAEVSCADSLRVLERLFPGTRIVPIPTTTPMWGELEGLIERATLVVDPEGCLDGIDRACAALGANFLGKSPLWPGVEGRTLLGQARLLLTDYPLAERRMAFARNRMGA